MRHPTLLAAAAIALLPVPALAEPDEGEIYEGEISSAARELADPVRQEQLGAMAGAVMEAMLEMPAAPLLRAAAQVAGENPEAIHPDTRLADLAGPEAADAPREVAERLPQMMGAMAALAVAFEDMLPHMRAIGEDLADDFPADPEG
jgi:hypothetical protein